MSKICCQMKLLLMMRFVNSLRTVQRRVWLINRDKYTHHTYIQTDPSTTITLRATHPIT